ncbi:MAG: hypothetical protein K0S86_3800 [Geminicoccaceae bacterium]|nr:hypothetical protein [Geminicoccaceae bacterium]
MQWDVFISHASEDKSAVARPLATKLQEHGLRVWLDDQELLLGDSLRRKIDEGLSRSRWGVLVLSKHFLEKEWPQAELDGLLARELAGEKVILPIWHGITAADVARRSPILAARIAVTTESGLEHVCAAILRAVGRAPVAPEPSEPHRKDLLSFWHSLGERRAGFARADVADYLRQRESYAGQVVAEYVLKDLVGIGGSGAVFKAVHRPLGRVVALKLLFPAGDDLRMLTQATERAVRGISSLRHPGVAALLDYGYVRVGTSATTYLAHELVQGRSLTDWTSSAETHRGTAIGSPQRATTARRLNVAIAITEALSAAHNCRFIGNLGFSEQGVLHGDLKPSNILVRDASDEPVLLDFMLPDLQRLTAGRRDGWSAWEKDDNGRYHYNVPVTGAFGTPGYMPPEQEIDGIVTPLSDIYALGRTFADLFWPGNSIGAHLASAGAPAAIETAIGSLVVRMTAAQPEERPRSADDVLTSLRSIAGG